MRTFRTRMVLMVSVLLLSAVSAFAGESRQSGGFYGPYVPYGGDFGSEQRVESKGPVMSGGFYGAYVPFNGVYGAQPGEWGNRRLFSGSYGAYGPYLPKGVAETTRNNCLVVATLCPLDIFK